MSKFFLFLAKLFFGCLILQPISVAFIDYTSGTYILTFFGLIGLMLGALYVVDILKPTNPQ